MVADIVDRPSYGTPEWCALSDDDPAKLAGVVVAAECWASDRDEFPARLAAELLGARAAAEQADWDEWRAANAAEYATLCRRISRELLAPGMAELGRRLSMTQAQRIAEARRPRPGDYPGRAQAWHGVRAAEEAA